MKYNQGSRFSYSGIQSLSNSGIPSKPKVQNHSRQEDNEIRNRLKTRIITDLETIKYKNHDIDEYSLLLTLAEGQDTKEGKEIQKDEGVKTFPKTVNLEAKLLYYSNYLRDFKPSRYYSFIQLAVSRLSKESHPKLIKKLNCRDEDIKVYLEYNKNQEGQDFSISTLLPLIRCYFSSKQTYIYVANRILDLLSSFETGNPLISLNSLIYFDVNKIDYVGIGSNDLDKEHIYEIYKTWQEKQI